MNSILAIVFLSAFLNEFLRSARIKINSFVIDLETSKRILIRLCAVLIAGAFGLLPVLLIEWLYLPIFAFSVMIFLMIIVASAFCFLVLELSENREKRDDEWLRFAHLSFKLFRDGLAFRLNKRHFYELATENAIWQLLIGIMSRAFFAAVYYLYFVQNFLFLNKVIGFSKLCALGTHASCYSLFLLSLALICTFDSALAAISYLSASRIIGTQIKSVDSSPISWVITLVCYHPFCLLDRMALQVFSYSLPFEFLNGHPFLWSSCSFLILLLLLFYAWSNLSFGIAFSNLSNRGIVASGPYRFLRHPAYSSKVIVWWLCLIPVCFSQNYAESLCSIVGMAVVSSVFYLRAITEERHLLADPNYKNYCKLVPWRFIPLLL